MSRSRGPAKYVWGGLAGAGLLLLAVTMTIRSVAGAGHLGGAGGALTAAGAIFGGGAFLIGVIASVTGLLQRGQVRALPELRARFPESIVCRVYGEADFVIGLSPFVLSAGARVPHFLLLVTEADGIAFYTARSAEPIARVAATSILAVRAGNLPSANGPERLNVILTVQRPEPGPGRGHLQVAFLVMRETGLTILQDGPARVREVTQAIGRIPGVHVDATGSRRGLGSAASSSS
jgi:hypothetical protein